MRRLVFAALGLVAAIAVAVLVYSNRRADTDIESQYYIPKKAHMTPEIERLQAYVRIDTSNPPGLEREGAHFLADLLEKGGVRPEIIESAPGRTSVYARIKGRRPNEGLLLLNHIDVVPTDGKGWSHPPFSATISINQLWGRGSLDMKSIGLCELEGFLAVARSGRVPERDIVFLAEADEEQGGALGLAWLLSNRPDIFEGVRYALNEGGITETQREAITYFGIETGTKMTVAVRLRAPARDAMRRVRLALEPYFAPRDPERVLPEVREFFHELAPQRIAQRTLLEDLDRTVAAGKFWLLPRGYKELTQNVVWARGVSEDNGIAKMDVLLFNLPDEDPERRLAWLRDFVRPYGATIDAVLVKTGPAPLSSRKTPLFALLEREIRRTYGDIAVGTEIVNGSYNDCRYLRARGTTCYGLWPFPVDYFQSQGIHGVDERIRLDWYMSGVELSRRLVGTYAFSPTAY